MRLIILSALCVLLFGVSIYAEDMAEQPKFAVVQPDGSIVTTTSGWVALVSGNTVAATSSIVEIKADMPQEQQTTKLNKALSDIQKMKEESKKYGLMVEGFSLTLGFPPSVTVNFKFVSEPIKEAKIGDSKTTTRLNTNVDETKKIKEALEAQGMKIKSVKKIQQ